MDNPKIAIQFITYNREEYAVKSIQSVLDNLVYHGEMHWYLADAGSEDNSYAESIVRINEKGGDLILGGHSEELTAGQNWNKAIREIFYSGYDIYLRLEDDFVLTEKLDITPYVRLLVRKDYVGMVRLGLLPIFLDLHTVGYDGLIYTVMLKSSAYAYSGNPALIHRRFHDAYGLFNESIGPGECEVALDNHIRRTQGPEIWRPVDLGSYSPFNHIGEKQSYQ